MASSISEVMHDAQPVVFITGATASGKSEVGLEVAQSLGGEIVCIDSRTIYKGMDIGTAKPAKEEQTIVPHHLLDIANVDTPLSATDFQYEARASIADIFSRGKLPILIGGASLYGDVVLYDFVNAESVGRHESFEDLTVQQLRDVLQKESLQLPFNAYNHRDLSGYAELYAGAVRVARLQAVRLGIKASRSDLISRIEHRTRSMMDAGLESEVQGLVEQYGWGPVLSSTIGYQEFRQYFEGKTRLGSVAEAIVANTVKLAEHQASWFRRYEDTTWVGGVADAIKVVRELQAA